MMYYFHILVLYQVININADITLLNPPTLPFTEQSAKSHAIALCSGYLNFFSQQQATINCSDAFQNVFGNNSHYFDEHSKVLGDGRAVNGYNAIKMRFCIAWNLISFAEEQKPCNETVHDVEFHDHWVQFTYNTLVTISPILGGGTKNVTTSRKLMFHPQRRTVQNAIVLSSGQLFGAVIDFAVTTSTTALSAAAYLGLIETQIEGSNENIQMIS
eukprot:789592_1